MSFSVTILAVSILSSKFSAGSFVHDTLSSWITVTNLTLIRNPENMQILAILETDDSNLKTLQCSLRNPGNLHGDKLRTSNSHCLFEGSVISGSCFDSILLD